MNFDFSEDQRLLQQTARDFLNEHAPLSVARKVLESPASHDADLWKRIAGLGWLGTAIPEEHGGSGFGHLELALLAEEVGRSLAPVPFASSVYLATEALLVAASAEQQGELLPRLATGERVGTLALWERAGQSELASRDVKLANGRVTGTKAPVLDGDVADLAVVLATGDAGQSLVLVDLSGPGVTREPIESFDPSRSQARLVFQDAEARPLGKPGEGLALAERILDRAAVLMAFEQIGGAERAFDLTRDFVMGRYAFGRPIASFQAVKHRLADIWVAIELARSNAYYAAWALSTGSPELGVAACAARAAASDVFRDTTVEMVQLHGGVGYTWEYDCHLFYRRAVLTGLCLGSAARWRDELIRRLEQGGETAAAAE